MSQHWRLPHNGGHFDSFEAKPDEQLGYFSACYRAISFDYPGYGESDLPPHDLDRVQVARYILGALDAQGIEAAHIVGLSMGGVIGLEMWRQQPHRLLSLTLADTFAKHSEGDAILERTLQATSAQSMRDFAMQRVDYVLQPGAAKELREAVIEKMAGIDPHSFRWASRAVWTADYRADLSRINIPTLVLVGEHDTVTPLALSQELEQRIPGARLRVIPAAGHISNFDNPVAFNEAVTEFLDSLTLNNSSS